MSAPTRPTVSAGQVHQLLEQWQQAGLLDAAAVERIEAAEAARTAPTAAAEAPTASTPRPIIEAFGYVGAALVVVAIGLLVGREWHHFAFGTRVALLGGAAVLMFVGGAMLPGRAHDAAWRLKSVFWTVSTGLALSAWVLVAADDGFGWSARAALVFAGALAAVQAAALWWRLRAVPLHLATFASLAVVVGAASSWVNVLHDEAVGVGLVLFGAIWSLLGAIDAVRPHLVAWLAGALVAVSGALSTTGTRWGAVLVLAVVACVVVLAVRSHSLALLAVGTYGLLAGIPAAASRLFHGSLAVAIGLLVAGLVLSVSGLMVARRSK